MDVDSDASFTNQSTSRNYVKFYPKWVRNNFKSEQEGKEVGDYRDFVLIICPGQPKSEVHREVRERDRQDYAQEWAAYKAGKEQRLSGTPVELLPGLEASRADSLKTLYIHTIEQLAELSQPAMQRVGMGAVELVQKAKAYLSKNSTEVVALKTELAKRDETIAEMQRQLAELSAAIQPRKPGRPKKVA